MSSSDKDQSFLLNNPAGRLYVFIRKLRGTAFVSGATAEKALCLMWNIPEANRALFLSQLSGLMTLPFQIRDAINRHDDMSAEILLKWLPTVESALSSLNLQKDIEVFRQRFDEKVVYGVELCSDYLSRRSPEKVIPEADIQTLAAQVLELKESVINSADLSPVMKRYLLVQLDGVERAIRDYYLCGTVPLEQALNAAIGSINTNHTLATATTDSEDGKSVWKFFGRIQAILATTWTTVQIGDKVGKMLGMASVD